MTKIVRSLSIVAAAAIACVAFLAPLAGAADSPSAAATPSPAGNVLLKFRIGKLEGGHRVPTRSYDMLVASDGSMARLLSGARVPIPITSREDDKAGATEERKVTSFTYQNVGFSAEARVTVIDKTKIRLSATIEDSRVKQGESQAPPIVETRQLSVEALLTEGVPIEVVRVEGNEESGYVEVEAKILR